MPTKHLTLPELHALCRDALQEHGASDAVAEVLATATVEAEASGQPSVGISHLFDYLDAMRSGQIDGRAEPKMTRPAPAMIHCDARGGIAHTGFVRAFDDLVDVAMQFGIALFSQRNAFTSGALSWLTGRLADRGLVGIAATSGPAMMAAGTSGKPVYCTNPIAMAAPAAGGPHLLIDQSSSATAYVSIRDAAAAGITIPAGWAVDSAGQSTTDPSEALKGALLAFGGSRGANIALMVEVLAAGLSGASWALDAPEFVSAPRSLDSGLFVLALRPDLLAPDFAARLAAQLDRLHDEHGVYIPGRSKAAAFASAQRDGLDVDIALLERLRAVR